MTVLGSWLNNWVKDWDLFGHQVVLNFNKAGESHKTLLGGMGSLLVQTFMVVYVYIKAKQFLFNEADMNVTENGVIDLDKNEDYQDVPYNAMNMTIF